MIYTKRNGSNRKDMYYIIDVDKKEILAEFEKWEDAFRKASKIQAFDSECEVYRDLDIIQTEDLNDSK